jgi:GNAT superfamily N-acetyltransferase
VRKYGDLFWLRLGRVRSYQHNITYLPANDELKIRIQQDWSSNAGDYISLDEESFSLGALADAVPIGVISARKRPLTEPLCALHEAFIYIIEVSDEYRRLGIGSALVEAVIVWAKQQSVLQVGAWSMSTRVEVLHLWHKFGFTFVKIDTPQQLEAPHGFYAVKRI